MCESISIQYSCFDFSDMSISTLSKHISVSVYNGQSKQTPLLLDKTQWDYMSLRKRKQLEETSSMSDTTVKTSSVSDSDWSIDRSDWHIKVWFTVINQKWHIQQRRRLKSLEHQVTVNQLCQSQSATAVKMEWVYVK